LTEGALSYMKLAHEIGGGEFIGDDFKEEIYEFASPYVENLYRMKMVDQEELRKFINFCEIQIAELYDLVKEED